MVPKSFVTGDWCPGRQSFHGPGRWKGDILGMIQVHYIYYEIYVVIITTGIRSQRSGICYTGLVSEYSGRKGWKRVPRVTSVLHGFVLGTSCVFNFFLAFCTESFNETVLES